VLDVLSVGNANVDLIVNARNLPRSFSGFKVFPGGSACNFAVGCSRLGLKSGFLGFTGKDSFGGIVKDALKREGVQSFVKVVDAHTGFVVVFTKKRFKKFLKYEGANVFLNDLKLEPYFSKAKHLHLATPTLSLLRQLRKGSFSVDPGSRLSQYSFEELELYLKKVNLFFPNEEEARLITGLPFKRAARRFLNTGIDVVIIKLGRRGCYVASHDEAFKAKSLNFPVTDTTGAGDAFASAFTTAWLKGKSLREATEWALISSNICISKLGAQNSPDFGELSKYKSKFTCC
jgi:sugar/nucleoside kinase (ribokinase family)